MKKSLLPAAALCALLPLACKSSTQAPPVPDAGVAVVCNDQTPCSLTPGGTALTGMITAVGQVDTYTVEVPASRAGLRSIVQVVVTDSALATPVRLVDLLETPDGGAVLATRGPVRGTGAQLLTGNFLVPGPGVYRVIVRDVLTQATDSHNGYSIQAAILDDPDAAFEPDNTIATARPIAFAATPATLGGTIAYAGDIDITTFSVVAPGAIAHLTAAQTKYTDSPLQLRVRLLQLSPDAGTNLGQASILIEADSAAAGAGLAADKTRFLPAGNYAITADDVNGLDGGADARPVAAWSVTLQTQSDPDPNEQTSRNDSSSTPTALGTSSGAYGAALQGAIGSQGDRDWYRIDLPATSTMQILEVKMDPQTANTDLELNWTVAEPIGTPSAPCDTTCGPTFLCTAAGLCAMDMHAEHHFVHGETTPAIVRIRHFGPAEAVYVVVNDFGDLRFSSKLYALSARVFADPDANDLDGGNDSLATATVIPLVDAGAQTIYTATGEISAWDFIDGRNSAELRNEVDWYSMTLPPHDLGEPDGGCQIALIDGGTLDGGLADGGCPLVVEPRPDYGITVHWHGSPDGVYQLGLQATAVTPDGGQSCLFSFDQNGGAHSDGDGGYIFGTLDGGDHCLCLAAANAEKDKLWLRVEAAHRPQPGQTNVYSDQPYQVDFELTPRALQPLCDGGCAALTNASSGAQCPGQ